MTSLSTAGASPLGGACQPARLALAGVLVAGAGALGDRARWRLLAPLAGSHRALGGGPSAGLERRRLGARAAGNPAARTCGSTRQAAQRYGLDWAILAGIGKVECDHGRDPDPSCTQEGAVNSAGAGGPMQFIASTWARYGVDGDGDGTPDRWDPADAIFGGRELSARLGRAGRLSAGDLRLQPRRLVRGGGRALGGAVPCARRAPAPQSRRAKAKPDGADRALAGAEPDAGALHRGRTRGARAGDGHLALIPAGVPATVQAMLVAGNELQDLPYGPGGHPDPRGAIEEDCSSTVNYVLYRSGVRPIAEIVRDNPLAQDYVHWGAPGPGRWVTIYATDARRRTCSSSSPGLRLDTSHDGTDVGPNRDEDGPRWRILDHIPTWAHWSVRHPPGLVRWRERWRRARSTTC